jgi:UDP-N-acetylmuramyl tripeptide synthase
MGAAAADLSDFAFVTSDNPRDEDPSAIIDEVLAGVPGGLGNPRVVVEADRGVAIRQALDAARPGDVVVIAGKGHETYQEVAGRRLPFDDAVEARRALSAHFASNPRTWAPSHPGTSVGTAAPGRSESMLRDSRPEA